MKETRTLEFKEKVTKTFLKTVSAYANYGTGQIIFGISDEGEHVGVDDPTQTCLDIENTINDTISPKPRYTLEVIDNNLVCLEVEEGKDKPYFYKGKAYKRNDTSSIEVTRGELNRLTLAGTNRTFDELKSANQELTFKILEAELQEKIEIKTLTKDILRTLNLYNKSVGYDNAAALLSDENTFPGIDTIKFGSSMNEIADRSTFAGESIIMELHKAVAMFRKYYQYEEIDGLDRRIKEAVPEVAFREAIANALVHRVWDVNAHIRVAMFDDRIEIYSPGGLPFGISEQEYLEGYISVARNPIIANVFFRLNYIEQFGTGIQRIKNAYLGQGVIPSFKITENAVVVVLPIIKKVVSTTEEEKIIAVIRRFNEVSSKKIMEETGYSKTKTNRLLKKLLEKHIIIREGAGRATTYRI